MQGTAGCLGRRDLLMPSAYHYSEGNEADGIDQEELGAHAPQPKPEVARVSQVPEGCRTPHDNGDDMHLRFNTKVEQLCMPDLQVASPVDPMPHQDMIISLFFPQDVREAVLGGNLHQQTSFCRCGPCTVGPCRADVAHHR